MKEHPKGAAGLTMPQLRDILLAFNVEHTAGMNKINIIALVKDLYPDTPDAGAGASAAEVTAPAAAGGEGADEGATMAAPHGGGGNVNVNTNDIGGLVGIGDISDGGLGATTAAGNEAEGVEGGEAGGV